MLGEQTQAGHRMLRNFLKGQMGTSRYCQGLDLT